MLNIANILNEVLCCPDCKGELRENKLAGLLCVQCSSKYVVDDGIYVLMPKGVKSEQDKEREVREKVASEHGAEDIEKIYRVIEKHHCIPLMISKAHRFRSQISNEKWIVDVGCGSGYYWKGSKAGAKLILIDFAMSNLKAAKNILKNEENILYVQADASCMPLKSNAIAGAWSVQVTQHFPDVIMSSFLDELKRIFEDEYYIEVYNLNPALLHRCVYRLFGKIFHVKGQYGDMLQNKLNSKELLKLWSKFLSGTQSKIKFSELFFHPNFRMFPQAKMIVGLERLLSVMPFFTKLFARQISIHVCCNGKDLL